MVSSLKYMTIIILFLLSSLGAIPQDQINRFWTDNIEISPGVLSFAQVDDITTNNNRNQITICGKANCQLSIYIIDAKDDMENIQFNVSPVYYREGDYFRSTIEDCGEQGSENDKVVSIIVTSFV